MAFPIKKFLHGPGFQKSAKIGKPLLLEAELDLEASMTKRWAAYSRLFWTFKAIELWPYLSFSKRHVLQLQKKQPIVLMLLTAWADH